MKYILYILIMLCFYMNSFAYKVNIHNDNNLNRDNLSANFSRQIFDFSYSGDISDIPDKLKNYNSKLKVLHYWGIKKAISINLDLQMVNINDLVDAIQVETNGAIQLIYNAKDNSIRLNFLTKLDTAKDALNESLKWQNGQAPKPILKADGIVRFPFGEYEPVITCEPMNLCDLELQAGENILGIAIGDSIRWNEGDQGIPIVYSGSSNNLIPHLILKPSQGGLMTSLIITTSRRTYMLKLKSANNAYIARAGFYYPEEMIQKYDVSQESLIKNNNRSNTLTTNPEYKEPLIDITKIKYDYTIMGDDYPWKPVHAFDDGISVYIELPDGVDSRSLPGLCIIEIGDDTKTKCEMVNFRYNSHYYIIDQLFDEAKLVNGFDDRAEIITIKRKSSKSFWSKLFGKS